MVAKAGMTPFLTSTRGQQAWTEYIILDMTSPKSGEPLTNWIRERIQQGGPVTVAQFMDWALYHPAYGYYTAGPDIGPRGDFTTSPEASPAFGRLMARHVVDVDRLLGSPAHFTVVECGPGKGTLAHDFLVFLKHEHPDLYSRLTYYLLEISPGLAALQRDLLLPEHDAVARWAHSLEAIPGGLQGAVLANEFVDALPVHVVENRSGKIVEQFVSVAQDGSLELVLLPPSRPELIMFLDRRKIKLAPGQRTEINLVAESWLCTLADRFERSLVTIIDYGDTAPARYSPARLEGTLLGYYRGAVTDKITARPGQQDLTALVDFSALEEAAATCGLEVVALTRQANFLLGLGLGTSEVEVPDDLQALLRYRRGIQELIAMEGLGRFHVLLLARGVDHVAAKAILSGLKYFDLDQLRAGRAPGKSAT